MSLRGFVLQSSYRLESGKPVVHLYGRLESGGTFLVRDRRVTPYFYVRASDAQRAQALGARPLAATGKRTLLGEEVLRVEVAAPSDAPALRDRLIGAGIPCYEADVRFGIRYLIDRGVRGSVAIEGSSGPGAPGIDRVFEDPEIGPSDWTPSLNILSFDIETDRYAQEVLSISLYGSGASEVLLLLPKGKEAPPGAIPFRNGRELLQAFCRRVREIDPDVLTGWNVIDFDLATLVRVSKKMGMPLELGRGPGNTRVEPARFRWGNSFASVPGRVVLDGLQLLRGAFVRMEEYSLDFVAREVLGEGKIIGGDDRFEEIVRAYHDDLPRFVAYNLTDSRLVLEILEELELVELAIERSRLTGMPLERVSSSIASFDFLYLMELGRRDVVAPTVGSAAEPVETTGGAVLEPEPGLYRNVLVFDFKSLYPSVIRTFQIDPQGYVRAPAPGDDPIVAPNGAAFGREPGILPRLLDELFPRREAAKAAGQEVRSQAIKILMNSFYGVLGTPACRFHNAQIANAITGFGREILLWSKRRIESYGARVLYGDTDSLFVLSGEEDVSRARELGHEIVRRLNHDLAEHVRTTWRVSSKLELQFDRLYLRILLPRVRHGTTGARKRYAGLVEEDGERHVVFTGMEVVRRDWTELAKRVQRELYARLFSDRPLDEYLKQVVRDVRAGAFDDLLVYRKGLRKDLDDYTATTPPHVAAARKMAAAPGRSISYVMTTQGPEPAGLTSSPIDHEHYVQKQVRPVAEPVLDLLGLDFDRSVGDDSQLTLFE